MSYRKILFQEYTSTAYKQLNLLPSEEEYLLRERAFLKKYVNILPDSKTTSILDIGCGMGFFLRFLQRNGFTNTVGVDISPEQVTVAEEFGVTGIQLCDWKEYLAKNKSEFGFIMLDNVIEHLTKDEIVELLQAILLSLAPGGKVYISTPNSGSIFGLPLAFIDFTHEVFFTAASLTQVLSACGFAHINVFGEPLSAFDTRSWIRKSLFSLIKPLLKAIYIVGTGGGGRTSIPHIIEPSIAATAEK
jgi:2-polyprenyl-3-methyl-5-hydroxy-6-metoxy-1,4-benzoquinol methylase